MRPVFRALVVLVVVMCAGWPLSAAALPHVRTGFCAGVGFGLESVAWSDEDGRRPAEGSGAANARVGYAVKPDLVLGVECWGWAKTYQFSTSTLPVPVDVKLAATTACVTYFPGGGGFFMRLGAGFAYGRVTQNPPSSVTNVPHLEESRQGFAAEVAPGYEWRVANRLALGAQGDIVYLGVGSPLNDAFGYGLSAQFNWYW
jgi:hypothetical protein